MTVCHNSHSGFQMQSWRGRKTRPSRAEAGRVGLNRQILITGKYSSQGLGKIIQLCLHPSSRLQREDETKPMQQQQESREQRYASYSNLSRVLKTHVVQPAQTGEMTIRTNTGAIG